MSSTGVLRRKYYLISNGIMWFNTRILKCGNEHKFPYLCTELHVFLCYPKNLTWLYLITVCTYCMYPSRLMVISVWKMFGLKWLFNYSNSPRSLPKANTAKENFRSRRCLQGTDDRVMIAACESSALCTTHPLTEWIKTSPVTF